ncbi:MAG: hypothetical protein JXB24_04760 [Bacteroidales bacterium]|nr:hypothetical protein [Bacteroidales bacterium]
MNEKVLKYLIYLAGIICLYAFISIRYLPLFNAALKEDIVENYWDKTKFGELYYFSHILHFREYGLPPAKEKFEYSIKHSSISDCDILAFGDSFFEFSRHKQIPERLADDFNKKVHYVNNDFPLDYLAQNNYKGTNPKLVIFERVERYIPVTFENRQTTHKIECEKKSFLRRSFNYILHKVFYPKSEELYDAMLKRSYLTTGIYSVISTVKFDLFHYISKLTPVYRKDGKNSWLFYHDQVNDEKTSFYYKHTQTEMDSICNNMADLAEKLKEEYNMDMIYLPLPAKYTLYHTVINNDNYNDFLPRLYKGLDKRGVKYVNVYDDFTNSDTILYYHTDSHWNQKGIDMAYKKVVATIQADSIFNHFLNPNF